MAHPLEAWKTRRVLDAKWTDVRGLLKHSWGNLPSKFTDDDMTAVLALVGDRPPEQVYGYLLNLARSGERFRPSPAVIAAAVVPPTRPVAELPPPDFSTAWTSFRIAGRRARWDPGRTLDALAQAAHPVVVSWAECEGVARLSRLPTEGGDETARYALRDLNRSYAEHTALWAVPERRQALTGRRNGRLERHNPARYVLPPSD